MAEFQNRQCDVLGINTYPIVVHERWLQLPAAQGGLGGLNFPLASDENGQVCQLYGVYSSQKLALRGLFLIDPNNVLQYAVVHGLTVGRSTDEVLRVLDALQTGGLCPSEWERGDATLDPGRTLGPDSVIGQYRIEALVGSGAFGTVFRAWDLMLERRVALKVLSASRAAALGNILAEARAAAGLNHPNVCTVHAVERSSVPMVVMEYVEGEPLQKSLETGALAARTAAALGTQIALGMASAHSQGVVHGDLKPANIMVTSDGRAKITDFGLARRVATSGTAFKEEENEETRAGLTGTPRYMAPEQVRGEPATPASDVFALGLMLYEMSTGRSAIQGRNLVDTLRRIEQLDADRCAAEVSEPFAKVVASALARDPRGRRITMIEIAAILERSLSQLNPAHEPSESGYL
jgi:serine/threonine protein kinase